MKFIFNCLILFLCVSAHSETFRIATGEFAPYCSETIKHQGFVSHLVREAFAREGYQVEFDFLPWKRAYEVSKNGEYDATSWWAHSEERAESFYFSDEMLVSRLHFFYLKDKNPDFDWASVADLTGYRFGLTRGYYTTDEIEAAKEAGKIQFVNVNNDEQNFRLLRSGRIDLIPFNIVTGMELLRTKFSPEIAKQFAFHPKPVSTRPGFLIFPKKNKRSDELRSVFNKGLAKIRKDGSYERMYQDLLSGYYSQ